MEIFAPIALVGWIPVSIALFWRLSPRRAVLVSFIGGWLFLPLTAIPLPGLLPDLDKVSAIPVGVLAGILLFDRTALWRVRPAWYDVPMLVWVVSPLLSSLANGLGLYDGLSAVLENLLPWGIPYWSGRIYFSDQDALRDLAMGIFIGGLLYVPLCWFEMLDAPYLHYYVYHIMPQGFLDALRFGGWRPVVFMAHGLMVALWMTTASVCGVVLWRAGALARWGNYVPTTAVLALVATTFALRSANAWVVLPLVLALLFVSVRLPRAWLVWGATALIGLYLTVRVTGLWYAFEVSDLVEKILPGKKNSVLYRFVNEVQIAERVWQQPLWGWGRWGRAFIGREGGLPVLTPDSLWILAFGQQGTIGLLAILGILYLPPLLFSLRVAPHEWLSPRIAPVTACALVLLVLAFDSLANAMPIPVYMIAAGGLVGWFLAARQPATES